MATVILLGILACVTASELRGTGAYGFTLRIVPQSVADAKGAKCLDGTPPGYYYRPGVGDDKNKWRIHFRGGGWCFTDKDCYYRQPTVLGSSALWPSDIGANGTYDSPFGFMNSSEPHFGNWTTVFIPYCDGSSYTSFRTDPVTYQDRKIWYRGRVNLDALLEDMDTVGGLLSTSSAVILTGTSAGGLATYIHASHVKQRLPKSASLHALPDAGFFLDHPTINGVQLFRQEMQSGLQTWNATDGLDQDCVAYYRRQGGEQEVWRCLFAQYALPIIGQKLPFFIMNSLYDEASVGLILQLNCTPVFNGPGNCNAQQLQWLQDYRDSMLSALQHDAPKGTGIFGTACYQHEESCKDVDWDGILVEKKSASQAFYEWYSGASSTVQLFDGRWPNNPTCVNIPMHGAC
eukprot:TRINITY_DN8222_c0_g1_i1.p1 TRINITY_DN8222_c0_g1~~TRINITY_DN8222_c0_g1_i1.p1  ORF type:complete len:404 (+),score=63.47 TRINITY_DN8222_c0_g1_i1:21-1232(+)